MQKKNDEACAKRRELENKLDRIRVSYSSSSTEYSKAKIELSNMNSQFENSQVLLETKKTFVSENEPKIDILNNELDKIEAKKELNYPNKFKTLKTSLLNWIIF